MLSSRRQALAFLSWKHSIIIPKYVWDIIYQLTAQSVTLIYSFAGRFDSYSCSEPQLYW